MKGLMCLVVLLLCQGCHGREAGEDDDPEEEEDISQHAEFHEQEIGLETGDDMNSEWALGKALQGKEARGSGEQGWKKLCWLGSGGGGKFKCNIKNKSDYYRYS